MSSPSPFELLTGTSTAKTAQTLAPVTCSKPKPLRANLSKELRELIMHMLSKKPKNLPFKLHLSHRDEYVAAAHLVHTDQ
jgi:hypothetical protein